MPSTRVWSQCAQELPNFVAWHVAGIPPPEGSDDAQLLTMSTLNEDGVMNVKQVACDRLLSSRVETKLQVRYTAAAGYLAKCTCSTACDYEGHSFCTAGLGMLCNVLAA